MPEEYAAASPVPLVLNKTVTFTGASGFGLATTSVTWFTQSGGLVVIDEIAGLVTTSLTTNAGATLSLGVVGATGLFVAAFVCSSLVTTAEVWVSTTPTAKGIALPAAAKGIAIHANIVSAVAVDDITAGVIQMCVKWHPLSLGATLA